MINPPPLNSEDNTLTQPPMLCGAVLSQLVKLHQNMGRVIAGRRAFKRILHSRKSETIVPWQKLQIWNHLPVTKNSCQSETLFPWPKMQQIFGGLCSYHHLVFRHWLRQKVFVHFKDTGFDESFLFSLRMAFHQYITKFPKINTASIIFHSVQNPW